MIAEPRRTVFPVEEDTADFQQQLEFTAGRGECDFAALAGWLDAHGYQGEASVEFEYRAPDMTLDDIEAEYDFGLKALSRNGWTLPPTLHVPS